MNNNILSKEEGLISKMDIIKENEKKWNQDYKNYKYISNNILNELSKLDFNFVEGSLIKSYIKFSNHKILVNKYYIEIIGKLSYLILFKKEIGSQYFSVSDGRLVDEKNGYVSSVIFEYELQLTEMEILKKQIERYLQMFDDQIRVLDQMVELEKSRDSKINIIK